MNAKKLVTQQYLYGVCYFPEHWNEELWDDDFRRMKEMSMNVVRMGEGAWNIWEPEEGRYCFELFDKAIALCEKHGLKVILGTPTYAPPAWLTSKYPEVLRKTFEGTLMHHGSRRHYNYTSPIYQELCAKIVTKLAEQYGNNSNVIGWQIDNEFNCHMDVSFAESDQLAFREWCKERYGTLDALNAAWGAAFWAQTYTDWDQVFLPQPTPTYHSPGHLLDFYRFTSDSVLRFARQQYDIIKEHAPHQFITHNGLFGNIDNHGLTEHALDFMSYDSYPAFFCMNKRLSKHFRDRMSGLRFSRVRGMSSKFMILEHQAGPGGQVGGVLSGANDYLHLTPKPGQMRLWAWQSVAHGADGLLFFRWRTALFGAETLWHGLNHYGNQDHRRLDEANQLGKELNKASQTIVSTECVPQAAMIYDYDNDSNCKIERYIGQEQWIQEESIYQALNERHVMVDQLSRQHLSNLDKMSRYQIVFYPNAQLLDELDVANLRAYIEQGGTVVFGPRSGYKDRSNRCYMLPFPGIIKELCEVEITDFTMVDEEAPSFMKFQLSNQRIEAPIFNDIIKPEHSEARVLARYTEDYYKDAAAVVSVPVGKGKAVYFGAFFTTESTHALLEEIDVSDPHVTWADFPKEVEVVTRRSAETYYCIIMNFTEERQSLHFKRKVSELLTDSILEGAHELEPYGVRLIKLQEHEKLL